MKMNKIETVLMNNPIRAFIQKNYEVSLLKELGGTVKGQRVLEIGCGRGIGVEIILEEFGAEGVEAIDLDPLMVEKAQKRLAKFSPEKVKVTVGDAAHIEAADESYDAVFDFGIIHHIPDWKMAVAEVARVLRPQGKFYFEEVTRQALDRWVYRTFLDHPTENRFSPEELLQELADYGLQTGKHYREVFWGDFIIGVSRKVGN